MKRCFLAVINICFLAGCILLLPGCVKDKITRTYQISTPVYDVLTKFRESIRSQPATPLVNTGKITVSGKYIFLSEPQKGIHVIDNSNPSSPRNVSFINIPGNEDMAIAGNTLYADAYADLVTLDISNPENVVAKNFSVNTFPDHSIYYYAWAGINTGATVNPDSINVVVGWITRDTTVDYDPNNSFLAYPVLYASYANFPGTLASSNKSVSTSTNGSTARFSIINSFLYTVGYSNLTAFDISKSFNPAYTSTVLVDWHVETIYPFKNRLFVGTNNGVYMYDVLLSPSKPSLLGSFTHVRGCDPVVADDNYAYVTINDSSACLGINNQLQVVDVKDLSNSSLVSTYPLTHPIGLAKDGTTLFICDDKDGLKVYNAADANNLQLIKQLKDARVYDVIAENGLAIVVASDGIYQYDYTDLKNIRLISKL